MLLTVTGVGLVAFAGTAFLQCPLTLDYSAFNLFLDDINNKSDSCWGAQSFGEAIKKSMSAFSGKLKKHKTIVAYYRWRRSSGECYGNG